MAAVAGGQLNATQAYDGTTDVELYITHVARNMAQFAWTPEQTSAVVKNKLKGGAATWLRGQEFRRRDYPAWPALRDALRTRYRPAVNEIAASSAIAALKQRPTEKVADFFDRVLAAVDLKNHHYTAAQKLEDAYEAHFLRDAYIFFSAGMREDLKIKAMSGTDPPTTADALLTAATAIETQMEGDKPPKYAVLGVQDTSGQEEVSATVAPNVPAWQVAIETLTKTVEAMSVSRPPFQRQRGRGGRGNGRGRGRKQDVICYNCRKKGHYAYECRQPRVGFPPGGAAAQRGGFPPRVQGFQYAAGMVPAEAQPMYYSQDGALNYY